VTLGVRRPWQAVDMEELVRRHPPAPEYFETAYLDDPERIAATALSRLKTRAEMAYAVPFFRDRWDGLYDWRITKLREVMRTRVKLGMP
jgi:hypothetical protein